jgi:hypothetical protein
MITEDNPIAINRQFLVMNTYRLNVLNLYTDEYAIRINYSVKPPVPSNLERGGSLLFTWGGYAKDNHGNEYNSCGGACGLSLDGEYTEGVLSFAPLFEKAISFLDVTMVTERIYTDDKYIFRVLF